MRAQWARDAFVSRWRMPRPVVMRWNGKSWAVADKGLPGPIVGVAGHGENIWSAGGSFVARFDGSSWAKQLDTADLGEGYHDLIGLCANSRFILVGDSGGHALVRPASP